MTRTMDEWTRDHTLAAGRQGWCISRVDHEGHAPWEIQRLDDAELVSEDWGIPIPQLDDDYDAAMAMRAAFDRGEPHAVLAYQLIKEFSPMEFTHWDMESWQKTG